MSDLIKVLLILVLVFAVSVFAEDEKAKKQTFEEYKKEVKEKYKDADIDSLIKAAVDLEKYYKFKSAEAYRELVIEKLEIRKKQIAESLKKIEEMKKTFAKDLDENAEKKESKNADSEQKMPTTFDPNLQRFTEIVEKILKNKQILTQCAHDICKHWLDEDKKGKENSLIYVKAERNFILSREKDLKKYYEEIAKYDEAGKFDKADQKRVLLKNALSRQLIFIDGKIKAYESTLKSIKRRKKLKDTSAQKKAELRIEYYKWLKPIAKKQIDVLKKQVDAEMNSKYYTDMVFFYENFSKYWMKISFPEYLKLNEIELKKQLKHVQKRNEFLSKDKKNPEKESRD